VYLLRLSEPQDAEYVCAFLRRVRVDVDAHADGTVSAEVADAQTPFHELRELIGYVTTWNALNPGSHVELVEP
jgi:hypothetical protein